MSLAFVASRIRRDRAVRDYAEARDRSVGRRLAIVWGLLCLNTLTFFRGYPLVLPIPHVAGQMITQGALPLALLVALTVNRRIILRPNVFLCLVSLLPVSAIILLPVRPLGDVYRAFRLTEFVVVLWLLTPWWGRRDLLLLRYHLLSFSAILTSVVLGLAIHPRAALNHGRLIDVLWPVPATEVAHYAAVIVGIVVVLWLGRLLTGPVALLVTVVAGAILYLSHTRTAIGAMAAAVIVAGLSLAPASGRVRKFLVAGGVTAAIAVTLLGSFLTTWLARGQTGYRLDSLTGRTVFWSMVLNVPRNTFQMIFGFGLADTNINGKPIDSNWLVAYNQQGFFGVIVCALILILLFAIAFSRPPGIRRALALFLMTYSLVASVTQVGFIDPTTYLLELVVAASLLAPVTGNGDGDESGADANPRFTWFANRGPRGGRSGCGRPLLRTLRTGSRQAEGVAVPGLRQAGQDRSNTEVKPSGLAFMGLEW